MFCKYKTNIAKRKNNQQTPIFLSRSHPSTLSISSILSIPPPEQQEEGLSIRT